MEKKQKETAGPLKVVEGLAEALLFVRTLEARMPGEDLAVGAAVRSILASVREGGRSALLAAREKYEGVPPSVPLTFSSDDGELAARAATAPASVVEALALSVERVRRYHDIQKEQTRTLTEQASFFASRVQPLDAVALYVPGGKAFYPSSVIMSAVPAQVAGVERLVVFTPARSLENPVFAATIKLLGVKEVHAVGGAQAVAAAAYGVEGIARVDKIVGPGNIYVATAKQQLAGRVGTDGFAGPSEILVLGDGSSPARWVAADMLAQAEHDEEASAVLVTTSLKEAHDVAAEVDSLLPRLGAREGIARASLARYGAVLVVSSREELVEVANAIASEHLHVHTACALTEEGHAFWMRRLKGVGAIFLGRHTAESFGDYLAGPSHVLPTAGTARFASALGVYDFVRRSSVLSMSASMARALAAPTESFALAEELPAHALAARLRGGHEP
jgi:histidinol dehydrogenase